jgi:hypothetical protein
MSALGIDNWRRYVISLISFTRWQLSVVLRTRRKGSAENEEAAGTYFSLHF